MSFWFYRKAKTGGRWLWQIDCDPLLLIAVIAVWIGLLLDCIQRYPVLVALSPVGLLVVGCACLVAAKVSLFRRGIWVSWGPRLLAGRYARLYKLGYVLIGTGAILVLLFR